MKKFVKSTFEKNYSKAIESLKASEKITKDTLRVMSRDILQAVHETGNIGYVNSLLDVLTPVNRKVCVEFFKHFAGFHYDDKLEQFTSKSKKRYNEAHKLAMEALDDPHFNVWAWAEREIDITPKPFTLDKAKKMMESIIKKADKDNISHKELFAALISVEGFDLKAMLEVMAEASKLEEQEQHEDAPM